MHMVRAIPMRFVQLEHGTPCWCPACMLPSAFQVRWLVYAMLPQRLPSGCTTGAHVLGSCSVVTTRYCPDCQSNTYVDPGE